MQSPCDHKRTQVIARRDGVDYVECLDCRQIFEAEDLERLLRKVLFPAPDAEANKAGYSTMAPPPYRTSGK